MWEVLKVTVMHGFTDMHHLTHAPAIFGLSMSIGAIMRKLLRLPWWAEIILVGLSALALFMVGRTLFGRQTKSRPFRLEVWQ